MLIDHQYIIILQFMKQKKQFELPKTYFDLVQKIGSEGIYQRNIMLIFILKWFSCGIILLSNAFLFLNRQYDCKTQGLLVDNCFKSICTLPSTQWKKYLQENNFKSIASELDQYYCSNEIYLQVTSSMTYVGVFIGYLIISFYSDNFGRRISLLVSWFVCTLGTLILCVSVNLYMVGIGLFLSGLGAAGAANISFSFFAQIVQSSKRPKYSITIMSAFCSGSIVETVFYIFIPNWRIVSVICLLIPSLVVLALIYFYAQQTPQFLIRKSVKQTLKALNRIGKINLGLKDILQEKDIQNVISKQMVQKKYQKIISILDFIRLPSLRKVSICVMILFFGVNALYYGPVMIVQDIGFNIYTSNIIINLSDLISYLPNYFLVRNLKRRKIGIILYSIALVCVATLIFVEKPQQCEFCKESIIQIILIFIFRFCISFYFALLYVYTVELFPTQVTSTALGLSCAIGTLALIVSQIYLGYLKRNDINVMIVFTIFVILSLGAITILHQTLNKPQLEQIEEITMQKNRIKTILSKNYSNISSQKKIKNY